MEAENISSPVSNSPIPLTRLSEITIEACKSTFEQIVGYEHALTSAWNTNIINTILQHLISESSHSGQQPQHKFTVTSTILQHSPPTVKSQQELAAKAEGALEATDTGKRGMHSATGAFWNNEKDGMWSHKHEEEKKGFDVVISIVWISII